MPAKVIPDNEVEQLLRQGMTDAQVADYLEEHHGIKVTQNAISAWRRRRGDGLKRPRYDELLPWTVRTEHAFLYTPKLLRFEGRRRNGDELAPRDARRLEIFKEKLAAAFEGRGGVVHYEPETDQGWWIVERREGVDVDMIRNPEVP